MLVPQEPAAIDAIAPILHLPALLMLQLVPNIAVHGLLEGPSEHCPPRVHGGGYFRRVGLHMLLIARRVWFRA